MIARVYKARLTSKKMPLAITADLMWHEDKLHVIFQLPNQTPQTQIWDMQLVKQIELTNSMLSLQLAYEQVIYQLDITDTDFIAWYKTTFRYKTVNKIKLTAGGLIATLLLGIVLILWLTYALFLPWLADYAAKVFPKEYEIKWGKAMYESVLSEEKIDSAKTRVINNFFHQLTMTKSYPARITVVQSTTVNAFAMPGGGIVVYEGILKQLKTPEALAALLSHEYAHVELKHATRNMFRSLSGYLVLSLVIGDMDGVGGLLVSHVNQLRNLSYSRELEAEADASGLNVLEQNRLNADGMISLFEQLKKEAGAEQVNELLSTHPDLDNRIKAVKQYQSKHPYTPVPNDSLRIYFNQLTHE